MGRRGVAPLTVGLLAGVLLGRTVFAPGDRGGVGNPFVTAERYMQIKPEMTEWDATDLIGTAASATESGTLVTAAGDLARYARGLGYERVESGAIRGHHGAASRRIERELVWRNGDRRVTVTFLNGRVAVKSERDLFW